MTESESAEAPAVATRDWILLPLVSLMTVLVMFGIGEITTRVIWSAHEDNECAVNDSSATGYHFRANCTARTKAAEGPWASYHFNECGYRSDTSCGSVAPGTLRIAIIGASVSQALNVPYEDTYYSIAVKELARICNQPVDVQNLGKPLVSPIHAYRQVEEALSLKPDVVLFLLAPFDLEQQIDPKALAERDDPAKPPTAAASVVPMSLMRRIQTLISSSRTVLVAEHFLLQNKATFLKLYLNYGDKADFLRQPFSPAWQRRFADLDVLIGDMTSKMRAAGVPFIVIPVPSRAEAALLSSPQDRPGIDPFAYGRRIESIATDHGAGYVDLMQPFASTPDSEALFLIVDGHVAKGGQQIIADQLEKKLLDGTVPAFAHCAAPPNQPGAARR